VSEQTSTGRYLTEAMRQKLNELAPRYPTKQALTLPALHLVQDRYRCIPPEAIVEIAEFLELAPAQVLDTMTFYGSFFRTPDAPLGQFRIWVCRSLPCSLCGGEELLHKVCHRFGVEPGGTSQDGKVTVEPAECLGACELAPCVWVNGEVVKVTTDADLDQLYERLQAGAIGESAQ